MMRQDILVYISGPITAKDGYLVEMNVADGLKIFLELTQLDIPSFCPQLMGAFPSSSFIKYEKWMDYDFAVIRRCTHMLMLPRAIHSDGAMRERDFAISLKLPIAHSISELLFILGKEDAEKAARAQISEG